MRSVNIWVRAFKCATRIALLCLAIVTLIMILAPRFEWAWWTRARLVAVVYRPIKFVMFAPGRDKRCSLADAWREAVPERAILTRAIARGIRHVSGDGNLEQIETPSGKMWIPAGDQLALAEELAEEGEDEYVGVHPGDIVLDCGANVGAFTREALRRGAARVVAIEPGPWAVECLRRNFPEEIRSGRVVVYPKGVWDHEDTLRLNIPPGMASTAATVALTRATGTALTVPLTTIDRLVTDLSLDRVNFIKMDIEGAELNALRGAVRTVERFHPRMAISLEHRHTDPDTISALTRQLWPNYIVEHGACVNMSQHLQPVVMYARSSIN
jgi:FkbM family methyltransferase